MAKRGGIGVRVRDDESFEKALRRFSKFCEKTGLIADMKRLQHYTKPSDAKRKKKRHAIRKQRRQHLQENRTY